MDAAGRALGWLREAAPNHTAEPRLWVEVNALLDALDAPGATEKAQALLGAAGLRMLEAAGWGLDLTRCVRCEKPVPARARTELDVTAGGVVCRACGGGRIALTARARARLLEAAAGDESALCKTADAELAVSIVARALAAHGRGAVAKRG